MWFKKSFIALSAALVLALNSDIDNLANYIAAGLFFYNGYVDEKAEDNRIRVDEIIDEWEYEKHKRQQKNEED